MLTRPRLFLLALLMAGSTALLWNAGSAGATTPPDRTVSYYVDTLNSQSWYNAGFLLGASDESRPGTQNRIVVLDFGSPALVGGVYGTNVLGGIGFTNRADLQPIAVSFAWGYYAGTKSDTTSHLLLTVGTSNYGSQVVSNSYQQGRAWSNFVNSVRSGAASFSSQVSVQGAIDIETAWNGPVSSRSQVDGFASINSNQYYDYGDAGGCPVSGRTNCDNGWGVEDVWYVAWGNLIAYSLPEIYNTSGTNANQWGNLARYSVNEHGARINFSGTLAQWQACMDVNQTCPGTNNTADAAWTQLWFVLQSNSTTAMVPRWSDDISWPF